MNFLRGIFIIALSLVGQVCLADGGSIMNASSERGVGTSEANTPIVVSTTKNAITSRNGTTEKKGSSTAITHTIEYWVYGNDQVKLVSSSYRINSNNPTIWGDKITRDYVNESTFTVKLTDRVITEMWEQGQSVKYASGACPAGTPITISINDSQEKLMAACGEPDYINKFIPNIETTSKETDIVKETDTTKEKDTPDQPLQAPSNPD